MIQKPFRGVQLNRTHPLAKGLVGCWLFNEATGETVFDLSGNGNNGTLENGTAWGSDGLDFDGVNDYVTCGDIVNTDGLSSITVSAWVKINTTAGNQMIITKSDGVNGWGFYARLANGELRWFVDTGSTAVATWTYGAENISGWHNLLGVYDGVNVTLYWDGEEKAFTPLTGNTTNESFSVLFGDHSGGSSLPLSGSIRSARIYNRALSAEEIAWSYREPYAMFEPTFNPALLYSVAPPVGAIMNQFQKANIGADLYNGVFA